MTSVLLANEVDINNITFTEIKKNTMGGHNVLLNYCNGGRNGPLIIQTPRMRAPFGADRQEPEGGGASRFTVNLTINESDTIAPFYDLVKELEDFILDSSVKYSEQWFGKKKSKDVVSELMRSVIKYPKDSKYDPTIKLKLPYNDKGAQFTLEDSNKQPINAWNGNEVDITAIPRGSELICVLQCTGINFIGKTQFGIGFKILKARVFQGNVLHNIAIIDEDSEDEVTIQD
jgi:hypothetical protein